MRVSGQYDAKLDAKGRVIVPAAHRRAIPQDAEMRLLAAPVFDDRKAIFFCEENYLQNWAKDIHEKLKDARTAGGTPVDSGKIVSLFVGSSREAQIDGQGRLLLPQDFRQACGIKNEARFIGTVGIIEIWKPDAHDEWARNVAAELDENTKARIRFGGFLQSESGS
ncbi:MAG: hypothetical protein F4X35_10810 [Alphaproteobacteria bacterium]|nr:hypothetical protein [Alphaproteobacteria bacterium]